MEKKNSAITDGLLIAAIPAFGYWIAFLYEKGYCEFYNIPPSFIEVGIVETLTALFGISGSILAGHFILDNILSPFYKPLPNPLKYVFRQFCIGIVFISGFSIVKHISLQNYLIIAALVFVPFFIFELVIPLVTQRNKIGYINKLKAHREIDFQRERVLDIVVLKTGRNIFTIFFVGYTLSLIAYMSGGFNARFKTDFIVISNRPETVVLKTYHTYFITADIDRRLKVVKSSFNIVPIDPNTGKFKVETIGNLSPQNSQ